MCLMVFSASCSSCFLLHYHLPQMPCLLLFTGSTDSILRPTPLLFAGTTPRCQVPWCCCGRLPWRQWPAAWPPATTARVSCPVWLCFIKHIYLFGCASLPIPLQQLRCFFVRDASQHSRCNDQTTQTLQFSLLLPPSNHSLPSSPLPQARARLERRRLKRPLSSQALRCCWGCPAAPLPAAPRRTWRSAWR